MTTSPSDRRWTIALVVLALTFPIGAIVLPYIAPSRSNMPVVPRTLAAPVVLVTAAGMQAGRIHHLGGERDITPSLDRLADIGISFTNGYADNNFEAGTTAAMLTGQCAKFHGIERPSDDLVRDIMTLPQHLRRAGWTTLAVVANKANVGKGFERGFDRFEVREGADAHTAVAEALDLVAATEGGNPRWFLWIDLGDLVPPYGRSPAVDPSAFAPDIPDEFGTTQQDYGVTVEEMTRRGWNRTQADWLSARYDAALADVDAAIGKLVAGLERDHWFETINLIVAGTCGTRVDERPGLIGAHAADLYEHSTRVPLIIHLPSRYIRGLVIDRFVQPSDITPTLLDLILKRNEPLKGRSLRQVMMQQQRFRDSVATEGWVRIGNTAPWRGVALRSRDDKLIMDTSLGRREFYDLTADPGELQRRKLSNKQVELLLDQADGWPKPCR